MHGEVVEFTGVDEADLELARNFGQLADAAQVQARRNVGFSRYLGPREAPQPQ